MTDQAAPQAIGPGVGARTRPLSWFGLCCLILLVLTIVRLVGLRVSHVDLFFDESQYWAWAQEPAFGYFSKPPLLAWIIAASQALCGTGEACVRAPSPVIYFATCLAIFAVARALYDARTAFWAALVMASAPGLVFSARIISTDVPLMLCWTLALLAYVKLWQGVSAAPRADSSAWSWTLVLGLALGVGMLAKYAMIYFVAGAAIAALIDRGARALLRRPAPWIALAIGLAILSPNVWWNIENGFVTLRHTGDNIQGGGPVFDVRSGLEFIGSQFAVIGPIVFGTLLLLFARMASPQLTRGDRLMLAFAIPALALVTANGFVTKANANWAAVSLVSAVIVTTAVIVRRGRMWLVYVSIALGAVVQLGLLAADPFADRLSIPGLAKADVYERTMGWRTLGDAVERLAQQNGVRSVVSDQRYEEASLIYYLRDGGRPVLAWPLTAVPDHQFDLTRRFTEAAPEPALFVTQCPLRGRLDAQFEAVTPLGQFATPSGPHSLRVYSAFLIGRPRGPVAPVGACR